MHLQPVFKGYGIYGSNLRKIIKTGLCLPSGSNLIDFERERIKSSLNKIINF